MAWSSLDIGLKSRIVFRETLRGIASALLGDSERTIEYAFVRRHAHKSRFVLDIGCSDSSLAFQLAKQGHEVYAVDIRKYPFRHKKLTFLRADARNLPFRSNSFDLCLCVSTIEHVGKSQYGDHTSGKADLAAMREMIKVAKPDGRILITTTYSENYRNIPRRERYYDDMNLQRLIDGLKIEVQEYYVPMLKIVRRAFRWTQVPKRIAKGRSYLHLHPRATICLLLRKP